MAWCSGDEHAPFATDPGLPGSGTEDDAGDEGDNGDGDGDGDDASGGGGNVVMTATPEEGEDAAGGFEFDPNEIYMTGDIVNPGQPTDGYGIMTSLSAPQLLILVPPGGARLIGNRMLYSGNDVDELINFEVDYFGTLPQSALDYWPEQPLANDIPTDITACSPFLMSPENRIITQCGNGDPGWYEDGARLDYRRSITYMGYDGYFIYSDDGVPYAKVGRLGEREIIYSRSGGPLRFVRARPNGVFHFVRNLGDAAFEDSLRNGFNLWSLDAQGNEGIVGRYSNPPPEIDGQLFLAATLAGDDSLYVSFLQDDEKGNYILRCRLNEDCTIAGRGYKNRVARLIASTVDASATDYVAPPPLRPTLVEGRDAATTFELRPEFWLSHRVYAIGRVINPGHENHGRYALANYQAPWNYVLGFTGQPETLLVHDGALHYRVAGSPDFYRFVPDYVGRLPDNDLDYYPADPTDNDMAHDSGACADDENTNIAWSDNPSNSGFRFMCGDNTTDFYSYGTDATDPDNPIHYDILIDLGLPPGPDFAGVPVTYVAQAPTGDVVTTGIVLPGLILQTLGGPAEVFLRLQDATTYELTNVFETWDTMGANAGSKTAYSLPSEWEDQPLVSDRAAALVGSSLIAVFPDEDPESDPDRKGDYIVRVEPNGEWEVSRAGPLAIERFLVVSRTD